MSESGSSFTTVWKFSILALALAINVALAWRLVWGEQSVSTWQELKSVQAQLDGELRTLESKKAALSKEIRLLQTDSAYVEKVIRQRLNYVRPGEILYLFDNESRVDQHWAGADADDGKN